ncbi:MAG: tRNA 4-thiouridine(8) synthase ThiI, partial [Bacilli bacterium]|nr:tRNA 4-thiouridine(8) synthase ThiI [Bacilli bacterium]
MRVILIKYGELSTKKGNRNFFINTLYNNVKSKLGMYDVSINKDRAKMTIKFRDEDFDDIVKIVGKVFGIHTFNIAYLCD